MTAHAGFQGAAPSVSIGNPERDKYKKMWDIPAYRNFSPGEESAMTFLAQAKPLPDSEVIDFGCGTGRGGLMLGLFGNMKVTLLDFADNCLDEDVANACVTQPHRIKFIEGDLTRPIGLFASYGYCTDVMEHIPPADVDRVLDHILASAQHVFFQICTVEDHFGQAIGEHLHLTVEPYKWWLKKLRDHGAVIHWSEEGKHASMFYVSTWTDVQKIVDSGDINTGLEDIKKNIASNIAQGYQQATPHARQETEVMILAGGPSLNDYTDEIIQNRAAGMKLVTTNGTYNWAIRNGMKPSAQIVVDAREFNSRFVSPVIDDCVYLLASQVHPSLFRGLPRERTYIWHACLNEQVQEMLDEHYETWFPTPGGSTVTLRAIPLLRMLGFYKFHIYGMDSCVTEDAHHAYEQKENDGAQIIPVSVGGRIFRCTPWMASQAKEFIGLVQMLSEEILLDIKGDGLIKHILTTGAKLEDVENGSNSLGLVQQGEEKDR